MQAAVIVRNNRSSLFSVSAKMDLWDAPSGYLGDWACASSGVGANSWSVCFGRSFAWDGWVNSVGSAKGITLGASPYVSKP